MSKLLGTSFDCFLIQIASLLLGTYYGVTGVSGQKENHIIFYGTNLSSVRDCLPSYKTI